jgi:hypothetical protein
MADERNRPNRAEEVRRERRHKPGKTVLDGLRLAVDETKLDKKNFEYRWVNDAPGRVQRMHDRDWDPATEQVGAGAEGTVQSKVVGTADGKPVNGVLMRKHKDWYREDQKAKQAPLNEMDKAIREGINHRNEPALRDGAYTPNGGNVIETSATR